MAEITDRGPTVLCSMIDGLGRRTHVVNKSAVAYYLEHYGSVNL